MQYQRVNGYAPTIRAICKMVGVASTSSVYAHLKILEEKGLSLIHIFPEGIANLLIPLVIYVAMFCADWKLALMSRCV